MSKKTNDDTTPDMSKVLLIAITLVVSLVGLVVVGVWIASQLGIH